MEVKMLNEEFVIQVEYHYYSGTLNRPMDGLLYNDNGLLVFETANQAFEYIEENLSISSDDPYLLLNGEYSAPNYFVKTLDEVLYDSPQCIALDVPEGLTVDGFEVYKENVPADVKEKLYDMNVEYYDNDGSITTFRAELETDDAVYGINYYVRNEVLDAVEYITGGDLSFIDWENPTFTIEE